MHHNPFYPTWEFEESKVFNIRNVQCRNTTIMPTYGLMDNLGCEERWRLLLKYLICIHVKFLKQVMFMAHVQIRLPESHIIIIKHDVRADAHSAHVPNA